MGSATPTSRVPSARSKSNRGPQGSLRAFGFPAGSSEALGNSAFAAPVSRHRSGKSAFGLDEDSGGAENVSGEFMRRLRRIALVAVVWGTAASTLMASTPHFVCRCPDGSVKPFCLGPVFNASGCCCGGDTCCCSTKSGGGCCSKGGSSGGQAVKRTSCCSQAPEHKDHSKPGTDGSGGAQRAGSKAGEGHAISSRCCQKAVAQQETQSVTPLQAKINESLNTSLVLFPATLLVQAVPSATSGQTVWEVFRLPPPTDLVTVLQRLTI